LYIHFLSGLLHIVQLCPQILGQTVFVQGTGVFTIYNNLLWIWGSWQKVSICEKLAKYVPSIGNGRVVIQLVGRWICVVNVLRSGTFIRLGSNCEV